MQKAAYAHKSNELNDTEYVLEHCQNSFYILDNQNLSPIIYAIWADLENRESGKKYGQVLFNYVSNLSLDDLVKKNVSPIELFHIVVYLRPKNLAAASYLDDEDILNQIFTIIDPVMVPDLLGAAVEYKAIKCTEKCTSKLTKVITDTTTFNKIRKEIEQNIAVYMKIPTRNLKDLLIVLAGTSSKQLLDNSDDLPKCKMIENEEDPFDCFQNVPGEFDYVNTVILKSQIKLPSIIGSTESVKFLRNLDLAENSLVFKSELVKYYLNYKWNKLLNLIIFQSLVVWSNIPLLISIIFIDSSNNYYIWAFIGTNSLLALIEITQIFVLGFPKYFGDSESKYAWTIIRMSSICLLGYLKFERIKVFEYFIFLVYSYCSYKISKKKKIPFITIISFIYSLVFWFGLENSFYTMIPMGSLLVLLFIITISFSNLKTEPWIPRLLFHALRLGV